MSEIGELIGFLSDVKPEVRLIAASHLLTVDVKLFTPQQLVDMAEGLSRRLAGPFDFTKVALSILVNVCDQEVVSDRLVERKAISSIVALVMDKETPGDVVELASMLLANMTRSQAVVLQLLETDSDFVGRRFLGLCAKFLTSKEVTEGRDSIAWLGLVLQNCSQVEDARKFLLDKNRSIMQHLAQSLRKFETVQRRRAVAAIIRNCLIETAHHSWLVEPPINLIQKIMYLLVSGKHTYSDEEKRAMPVDVREAAFDVEKDSEPDDETRCHLVECLVLLCYHGMVAERIKLWSGYPVMREMERFERNDQVMEQIFSGVEYLVREHSDFVRQKELAQANMTKEEKKKDEEGRSPADLQREILALVKEEEALMECAKCHKKDPEVTLARCTGCYSVSFCSKKCQVAMWKGHKSACLAIQERNKKEMAEVGDMDGVE